MRPIEFSYRNTILHECQLDWFLSFKGVSFEDFMKEATYKEIDSYVEN